jgi:hypothetical protein
MHRATGEACCVQPVSGAWALTVALLGLCGGGVATHYCLGLLCITELMGASVGNVQTHIARVCVGDCLDLSVFAYTLTPFS